MDSLPFLFDSSLRLDHCDKMSIIDHFELPQGDPVPQNERCKIAVAALQHLPPKLVSLVLEHKIGHQQIEVRQNSCDDEAFHLNWLFTSEPSYNEPLSAFDVAVKAEIRFLRSLAWRECVKVFEDPYTFALVHYFLLPKTDAVLEPWDHWEEFQEKSTPAIVDRVITDQKLSAQLKGLEEISLDFTAVDYFFFFRVMLPPFTTFPEMLPNYNDTGFAMHGAQFLTRTKSLTLNFGANFKTYDPWYEWLDDQPSLFWPARLRPEMEMCSSGMLIDWILSFAWECKFLQHIPHITLTGDVQEWVQKKWEGIFQRHAAYVLSRKKKNQESGHQEKMDPFAVFRPDLHSILFHGQVQGNEDQWNAAEEFPPKYTCKIKCYRLENGQVLPETEPNPRGWDACEEVVGTWQNAKQEE